MQQLVKYKQRGQLAEAQLERRAEGGPREATLAAAAAPAYPARASRGGISLLQDAYGHDRPHAQAVTPQTPTPAGSPQWNTPPTCSECHRAGALPTTRESPFSLRGCVRRQAFRKETPKRRRPLPGPRSSSPEARPKNETQRPWQSCRRDRRQRLGNKTHVGGMGAGRYVGGRGGTNTWNAGARKDDGATHAQKEARIQERTEASMPKCSLPLPRARGMPKTVALGRAGMPQPRRSRSPTRSVHTRETRRIGNSGAAPTTEAAPTSCVFCAGAPQLASAGAG